MDDGRTQGHDIQRASIASRGKNRRTFSLPPSTVREVRAYHIPHGDRGDRTIFASLNHLRIRRIVSSRGAEALGEIHPLTPEVKLP